MKTAIDASGRVLIPKKVRERAAFRPGLPLEARYADGCIVLEPAPLAVIIERRGRFHVARASGHVPKMTAETVESVRERIREGRGKSKA
jgi:bifunctional DNA-binding transcriptional regulator/antitoxin component of YhaV-PrlF toxin-antitoxin module